jgi:hypothetical protein
MKSFDAIWNTVWRGSTGKWKEKRNMMDSEKYVAVYATIGLSNALLIKGLLNSFNIPAETSQESAGIAMGLVLGPLGEAHVYVPESMLTDARSIIRAYENNELSLPENEESIEEEGSGAGNSDGVNLVS